VGAWLRRYAPLLPVLALYAAARAMVLGGGHLALAVDEAPLRPLLSYAYALQVAVAPFARLVYEPEVGVWLSAWRLGLAALVLAAALGARRRLGAPPWTLLAFWLGWFAVVQLPTANWLRQEAHFAERYTFLAFLAVPALAAQLVSVRWSRRPVRRATLAVSALAIALAAATSAGRAAYFRDDETFARQWLHTNPASPDAHHVLGVVLLLEGRTREAIPHLRTALAGAERSADIHANLGAALAMQGRDDEAAHQLEQALRIDPDHPEARRSLERLRARR
jgi:tetratricopeptide (TPR) repeat protein